MSGLVIQMLEDTLAKAKEHGFSSIVISVTSKQGNYYNWSSGEEEGQLDLIANLYDRLRAHVDNWKPFEGDQALDASYCCYNFDFVPPGFDFLTWLMTQEVYRVEQEAPGPLKVAFWLGRTPPTKDNDPRLMLTWLDKVYRPLVKMIGGVEDDKAFGRLGVNVHVTRSMSRLCSIGAKLPKLHAVGEYDLPKNCITITLRECDAWDHRNSDVLVWYEVAKRLQARGERVLWVRDTRKADEPLPACETIPLASKDLDARMWLYEHSKLNLFVSNGPMMLAALTEHVPYITFVMPEEMDSKYDANKPIFWKLKMGVQVGEQFPWAGSHQKIIWKKPDLETIWQAYEDWLSIQQTSIAAE